MFVAAPDETPASLDAIVALCAPREVLAMIETAHRPAPPGMTVIQSGVLWQMVAESLAPRGAEPAIEALTDDDAPEMLALATLTNPGPFFTRTHRLGRFAGVKSDGVLAAMAGERMKPEGFTEVSAVCTHPDHRGRGHAAALTRFVAATILARDEIPFLHVFDHNTAAIRVYEALGFRLRRAMAVTVLAWAPLRSMAS